MQVFIVIPAYNEAQRIGQTLSGVLHAGFSNIVVVDDGSTDDTYSIAAQFVRTLRHSVNRGMGAALVTGTQFALQHGADIIVHFDADGQHNAAEIQRVIEPIVSGTADISLGSRYLQENDLPLTKKFLIHKPALLVQNFLTGLHLTDVHSGFRAMARAAARQVIITQDRMAHASEITNEIRRRRLRYVEVPVTVYYREYGQGFMDGLKIYRDIFIKRFFKD
jgi:glycosyltransferase involved in cell wall biosynthesis